MKRFVFLVFMAVLAGLCRADAQQVSMYEFSSDETGIYESFSDGTVIPLSEKVKGERFKFMFFNMEDSLYFEGNTSMPGIDIGFDFPYAGEVFSKFIVSGMGFVMLGNGEDIALEGTAYTLPLDAAPRVGIGTRESVFGITNTSIAYKVEGFAPNRVLAVQFSNLSYVAAPSGDAGFNYQIRLHETTGKVEMLFDGFQIPEECGAATSWAIGLTDSYGSDHFRQPADMNWSATEKTTSMMAARFVNGSVFPEGLQFVFSRPASCETPTETIADIRLVSQSDCVDIEMEVDTNGYSEKYLVICSERPIEGSIDGMEYEEGDAVLGGSVLAVGDMSSIRHFTEDGHKLISVSHTGLEPNKTYYYAACLGNVECTYPRYTEAKVLSATTSTVAAKSIELLSLDWNRVSFMAEANDLGESILVAMTTEKTDRYYVGNFGLIPADAEVGDTLRKKDGGFGGIVLYVGEAQDEIVCNRELADNQIYYFGAFSQGASGDYSSVCVQDYGITPARIPFDDKFENMAQFEDDPFIGWEGTQGMIAGSGSASARMYAQESGQHQEARLCLPPVDFPADSNVLMQVSFSKDPWDFDMGEGDSIIYEISIDEGNTYMPFAALTMHSNSMSELDDLLLTGFRGERQVRIRIRVVSYNPEPVTWTFSNISLTGLELCDVPTRLKASSPVVGGNVPLSWNPSFNNEKEWHVSYSEPEGEGQWSEWSTPVSVTEPSYWLSGLGDNTAYKVRVRAVCNVGDVSRWVESDVKSGRVPSFKEDFNDLVPSDYEYYDPYVLPSYWWCDDYFTYEDTVSFSPYSNDVEVLDWKTADEPVPGESNAAVAYRMNASYYGLDMLVMPIVELIPSDGSVLSFDMAYGRMNENGEYERLLAPMAGHRVELWASYDSGFHFVANEPVAVWDSARLLEMDGMESILVDLSEFQGAMCFAWAIFGGQEDAVSWQEEEAILWIDNVGIANACPVARSLTVEDVAEQSARVEWVADRNVQEWIVKLENAWETEVYATSEDFCEFTGLLSGTEYVVSVGHLCGGDTSEWASIKFQTGGIECGMPTGLDVTEVTSNAALLTWQGEASRYRIKVRPEMATEWAYYNAEGNSYHLRNLQELTVYDVEIQSVCGVAAGDTSQYVAFESFATLEQSCFTPFSLRTSGTPTHNSAVLVWSGESESYQVEYDIRYEEDNPVRIGADSESLTVTGLRPDSWYQFRVRSICSVGDTSEWSDYRNFETSAMPDCPAPSDLRVESVSENSALLLWSVETEVNGFMLRYRESSVYEWDSVEDIMEMEYELTGLESGTVYLWSVLTACADGRYSGWANQAEFTTQGVANEIDDETFGIFLTASKGQIHLMNPSAVFVERVRIYNMQGRLLQDFAIRSNENAILRVDLPLQAVVVEVMTTNGPVYFKHLVY